MPTSTFWSTHLYFANVVEKEVKKSDEKNFNGVPSLWLLSSNRNHWNLRNKTFFVVYQIKISLTKQQPAHRHRNLISQRRWRCHSHWCAVTEIAGEMLCELSSALQMKCWQLQDQQPHKEMGSLYYKPNCKIENHLATIVLITCNQKLNSTLVCTVCVCEFKVALTNDKFSVWINCS